MMPAPFTHVIDEYFKSYVQYFVEKEIEKLMAKYDELLSMTQKILVKVDEVSAELQEKLTEIREALEDDEDIDSALSLLQKTSDRLDNMKLAVSNILPDLPEDGDAHGNGNPVSEIPPEQGTTPPTPIDLAPLEPLPGDDGGTMSPTPTPDGDVVIPGGVGVTTPGTDGSASETATPEDPFPVVAPVVDGNNADNSTTI